MIMPAREPVHQLVCVFEFLVRVHAIFGQAQVLQRCVLS